MGATAASVASSCKDQQIPGRSRFSLEPVLRGSHVPIGASDYPLCDEAFLARATPLKEVKKLPDAYNLKDLRGD